MIEQDTSPEMPDLVIYYITLTSDGYWGRGTTVYEAFDKAYALGRQTKGNDYRSVSRGIDIVLRQNIVTQDIIDWTGEDNDDDRYTGPSVDAWGSIHYHGILIDMPVPGRVDVPAHD